MGKAPRAGAATLLQNISSNFQTAFPPEPLFGSGGKAVSCPDLSVQMQLAATSLPPLC